MKRTFSLLACLLLLCALVPAATAQGALGADRNLFVRTQGAGDIPYVNDVEAVGDALYLLSDSQLYRWLPGDGDPAVLSEDVVSIYFSEAGLPEGKTEVTALFQKDGCLYGFGARTGAVSRLTDESGAMALEAICTLNLGPLQADQVSYSGFTLTDAFFANDMLYMLGQKYSENQEETLLLAYPLVEGGEATVLQAAGIKRVAAYKNGLLLGMTERVYEGESVTPPAVVTYDPATGEQRKLWDAEGDNLSGLLWNAETDTVYYAMDAALFQLAADAAAPQVCAYLPERVYGAALARLESGLLAVAGSSGVYLRVPQADVAANTLIISGEYGSSEHMAVVAEHPEMSITTNSDYLGSMEALSNAMVSGAGSMDVLALSLSNQPLEKLIDKGYALELSQFPALTEITDQMDPRYVAPLTRDGKLYAVPTSLYASCISVNRQQWTDTLGLAESDLPATWPELLDFIANYTYDYGDDHEELLFTDSWDLKGDLMRVILESEIAYQAREGGDRLSFATERFLTLMKLLDDIDFSTLSMSAVVGENATDIEMNDAYSKPALLTTYTSCSNPSCVSERGGMYPLVLPLADGLEPVAAATLEARLINPRSEKAELAAQYLAAFLNHLDATSANVVLFPDHNDPVLNPNYELELADSTQYLETRKQALETAAPENRAELKEEINMLQTWMENYQKTGGVLLSTEVIATWREKISPYLYPIQQTPVTTFGDNASSTVQNLLNQFAQGAINAEAFVKELDGRVRLMMLENQ